MTRLLLCATTAVLVLPVLALRVFAAPAGEMPDKTAIRVLYIRLANSIKAKDTKTIVSLSTPDFTETEQNGKVYSAKQALAEMDKHFKSIKKYNDVKMSPKTLAINGKKATATTDYRIAAVIVDAGKPHDLVSTGVTKDTLVKTPQGWKFKSTAMISSETTMDGQKVPAAAPPAAKAHRRGQVGTKS